MANKTMRMDSTHSSSQKYPRNARRQEKGRRMLIAWEKCKRRELLWVISQVEAVPCNWLQKL